MSARWEVRFRQLKEFKEEHGHCVVPQKQPRGLGIWAHPLITQNNINF